MQSPARRRRGLWRTTFLTGVWAEGCPWAPKWSRPIFAGFVCRGREEDPLRCRGQRFLLGPDPFPEPMRRAAGRGGEPPTPTPEAAPAARLRLGSRGRGEAWGFLVAPRGPSPRKDIKACADESLSVSTGQRPLNIPARGVVSFAVFFSHLLYCPSSPEGADAGRRHRPRTP